MQNRLLKILDQGWQFLLKKSLHSGNDLLPAWAVARSAGIDRRQQTRVLLPIRRQRDLPQLSNDLQPFPIVNLSVGGACVQDPNDLLLPLLGQTTQLRMDIHGRSIDIQVKVVGMSKHVNRHLQFLNLDPKTLQDIHELVLVGHDGQSMRQAPTMRSTPVQLKVKELWTNPKGDSLIFPLEFTDRAIWFGRFGEVNLSIPFDPESLSESHRRIANVFLCNIPNPSPTLDQMVDGIQRRMAA